MQKCGAFCHRVLSGHPYKRAHFWIIGLMTTLIRLTQTNRLTINNFPSTIYANSCNELLLIQRQVGYLFFCHRLLQEFSRVIWRMGCGTLNGCRLVTQPVFRQLSTHYRRANNYRNFYCNRERDHNFFDPVVETNETCLALRRCTRT